MKWTVILILGCFLTETTLSWTYHFSEEALNWTKARELCQTNFTDMVVIQNQLENDYIVSLLPNKTGSPYYWIGITKKQLNEPWTWVGNNSTWVGEHSWALNEPNNNHVTEFCVEIYVNTGPNRGKWNDEKCSNKKQAVCFKAQCNSTSCERGRCQETIGNTTCLCEPGFEGNRCQTAVKCPPLSQSDNGFVSCSSGSRIFNTTCQFKCHGFLIVGSSELICTHGANWEWSGPRPVCASYELILLVVVGSGVLSSCYCICFCCISHRKKQKLIREKQPEDATSPSGGINK
ncbi:L-selectin-like [Melanotaenia boesemani]|uniref:L-selectin-like n=1 Tax=Melanotaenia boesemani TaxID=1250792 RepID=UPI001C048DC7|nr:L-selectin-like [Melanotaenia boesemani]XP_041863016.1 L-selectin-like [Melanotaenia boesemani]